MGEMLQSTVLDDEFKNLEAWAADAIGGSALRMHGWVECAWNYSMRLKNQMENGQVLDNPLDVLERVVFERGTSYERRISAFLALSFLYGELCDYSGWGKLLEKVLGQFEEESIVLIQQAVFWAKVNGGGKGLADAIEVWEAAPDWIYGSSRLSCAYADAVASMYFSPKGFYGISSDARAMGRIDNALSKVSAAAVLSPGAEVCLIVAKLRACKKDYDQARRSVYDALGVDVHRRDEYLLHVMECRAVLERIDSFELVEIQERHIDRKRRESDAEFRRRVETRTAELDAAVISSRTDSLTSMSLFAGILALLLTGGSFVSDMEFLPAASLLVELAGVLILVFSVLVLSLGLKTMSWVRVLASVAVGVFLLLSGVLLGTFWG